MSNDANLQLLVCEYLRQQMDTLMAQAHGVRREDSSECVRQATEAARRLRGALKVFETCFPRKKVRRWRQHIKQWTRVLEGVREKDLQIALAADVATALAGNDDRNGSGVARFLLRARQQRQGLQSGVLKDLDRLKAAPVLAELHAEIEQQRFLLRDRDIPAPGTLAPPQIRRRIRRGLQQLLTLQSCLDDAGARAGHDRMWTTAQRLCDTMDIGNPVLGDCLRTPIEVATTVQALLGEMHDCDVVIDAVERFMGEEYRRTVAYFGHDRYFGRLRPGLEYLKDMHMARRQKTFAELVAFWKGAQERRVWQTLATLIDTPASPPGPARADSGRTADEPAAGGGASADDGPHGVSEPPPAEDLPGTLYRRGSRWWWRVRLPGEDRPKARALRPAGSRVTTTEQGVAIEIARALWERAEQAQTRQRSESLVCEEGKGRVTASREVVPSRSPRTVLCECCGRNGLLKNNLSRIDSGQRLCAECLTELRRKAAYS